MNDTNVKETKVGIFIPCHNEAEIITETIRTVRQHIESENFPYDAIIIIVDDGSTDNTYQLAKEAGADILYRLPVNAGLGAAARVGMEIAHYVGCTVYAKFDADLQHDVEDIYHAVKPIIEGEADVCYGSRFAGKINYKMPIVRFLGNHTFTWLTRKLTGWKTTDAQSGLNCFGRRYLAIFELPCTYNCAQQALIDASVKGMRYTEVPATFHKRRSGNSFIKWRYIAKVTAMMAKMSFYHYCFPIFMTFGATLILIGLFALIKGLIGFFFYSNIQYLPHATLVLFAFTTGILAFLFGLQSFAQINRVRFVRNTPDAYRYVVLEDIDYNKS